jgi:hypothetical protein
MLLKTSGIFPADRPGGQGGQRAAEHP